MLIACVGTNAADFSCKEASPLALFSHASTIRLDHSLAFPTLISSSLGGWSGPKSIALPADVIDSNRSTRFPSFVLDDRVIPHDIKPRPFDLSPFAPGLMKRQESTQRQLDPDDARKEAQKIMPLQLSASETRRFAAAPVCSQAYKRLSGTFDTHRKHLGLFWSDPRNTLNEFIKWYSRPELSQNEREKALPVIEAQHEYAEACLQHNIPEEVNPELVKSAVGLLMLDSRVLCSGLRTGADEVLTAKHCFVDPESGRLYRETSDVLSGKSDLWFVYEGEPQHRFGVCRSALPKSAQDSFNGSKDNIRLKISTTRLPMARMTWIMTPIPQGASLYLRGYFPFTENNDAPIARMRSTAVGGCFAHSSAGRCFFHACQTTPMMSGAPVFLRPEEGERTDTLSVVGLHLGNALLSDPNANSGSVCTGANGTRVSLSNFGYQP